MDLGCGDFRVGSRIARPGLSYHGVDVVEELIRYNTKHFPGPGVTFSCRDLTRDDLPDAQLGLIRQVLQHLSDDQVQRTLGRI